MSGFIFTDTCLAIFGIKSFFLNGEILIILHGIILVVARYVIFISSIIIVRIKFFWKISEDALTESV